MVAVPITFLFFAFFFLCIRESHGVNPPNISGIVTSAFTPFYPNGGLNLTHIATMAQGCKDYGLENLVLVAYSGEGPSMNLADRKAVVSEWVRVGKPLGLRFIVQVTGGIPFYDSVELVKFCYELKVEAILVLPETAYKGNLNEIMNDLKIISDAAPGLSLLYQDLDFVTNPKVSTAEVVAAALKQICDFGGVMTTMDTALQVKATQSLKDIIVMIIGHDQIAATFTSNFNASIDTAVNLFPKHVFAIEAAFRCGNYKEVEARQADVSRHIAAINNLKKTVIDVSARDYLINQKEAYRLIWGSDLGLRIPLVKPTPAVTQEIATNLQRLGDVVLKGYP